MSSQSTNDGTYALTVTFEVGTNLDMAQVQVQNRVAIAEPQLPDGGAQHGVTVKKASPDITLVVAALLAGRPLRHAVPQQLRHAQLARPDRPAAGVGDVDIFGARDYSCGSGSTPKARRPQLTAGDVVNADPRAERAGRRRRRRRPAGPARTPRLPAHGQRPGPPRATRRSSPRSSSRPATAGSSSRARRRPRRARRRRLQHLHLPQRPAPASASPSSSSRAPTPSTPPTPSAR